MASIALLGAGNMTEKPTDFSQLDNILSTLIDTVQQGQRQLFYLAESARFEAEPLKEELHATQLETLDVVDQLKECQEEEKASRQQLEKVTKNLNRHSNAEINQVYESAKNIQIKVALLREKEMHLREKQEERDAQLRHLKSVIRRSESLISRIGVAIDYLSSNQGSLSEVAAASDNESYAMAVIKAQEEERRRVARDIHDGPAQSVANLVLQVEYCQKLLEVEPTRVKEELDVLKSIAKANLENIRKIIFALRPMDLDDLGLVPAVKRYLSEFESTSGLAVAVKIIGSERRYSQALEVAIFRIIQEALNNVVKHAKASHVVVVLETQPNSICAVVRDDGIGFDVGGEVKENSFGLRGMKERIDLLEGEFTVNSMPGEGTEVFVKVPVKEEEW